MPEQSEQNPTAGLIRTTSANLTAVLSGLVTAIILARVFGAGGLGMYMFFLVVGQVIARIPSGLGSSVRKQIRASTLSKSEYYGVSLALSVVIITLSIFASIIGYATFPSILESAGFTKGLYLGTLSVVAGLSTYHLLHGAYTATNDTSLLKAIRHSGTAGVHVFLALNGFTLPYYLGAYGVIALVTGFLVLPLSRTFGVPSLPAFGAVFKNSPITIVSSIVSNFQHKTDVIIIGFMLGFVSVGIYEAALKLVIPVMIASTTVSGYMASQIRGGGEFQATQLVRTATTYSVLFALPILVIFSALSYESMWFIFGQEFGQGWAVLIALAATQLVSTVRTPLSLALRSFKKNKFVFGVRSATLLANIPLSIYLITKKGILGAVLATFATELLTVIIFFIFLQTRLSRTTNTGELFQQAVSAIITFGLIYGAAHLGYVRTLPRFIAAFVAGLVLYFTFYLSMSTRTKNLIIHKLS